LHIWIGGIAAGAETAFVLLQRRSLSKDTFPGLLDVAVGGHFRAGESLGDCIREAEEEIGLLVDVSDLTRIGRRFTSVLDGRDREVQEVYAVRSDLPLDAYRLHEEEVDGVAVVAIDKARRVFADEAVAAVALELRRGSVEPIRSELTRAGFAGVERGPYAVAALDALACVIAGRPFEPFELHD
jgi:8-oxo-dGTP pyrophosphatase MutT (NUDIX family)